MLTQNCQENFKICGYKVPQYFWFVISGSICDVFQAIIDYFISIIYLSEWEKPTVCWTLSYIITICIRHYSHSMIVFGEYSGTYCSSLMRTYAAYSSSIVISVITNHILTSYFFFTHKQAWIITMLWTGIYNYFMLKKTWKAGATELADGNSGNNSKSESSSELLKGEAIDTVGKGV